MKEPKSFRLSDLTLKQLKALEDVTGLNQTEVVAMAIDRMARDEMDEERLTKIAVLVHREVCGCDDKRCTTTTEIFDWLYNGDAANLTEADVPDLVKEWREYEGQE